MKKNQFESLAFARILKREFSKQNDSRLNFYLQLSPNRTNLPMVSPRDEEGTRRFQLRPISRSSRKPREIVRRKKGLPQRELLPRGSLYCKQTACIGFENLGGEEGRQRCTCCPLTRSNHPRGPNFHHGLCRAFCQRFFVNPSSGSRNDAHLPREISFLTRPPLPSSTRFTANVSAV